MLFLTVIAGAASAQPDDRIAKLPKINYDWQPGFVSITEFTAAPGISLTNEPYSKYYFGISTVAGYQFTRNIKAGLGAGVNFHNGGTLFPVFVDARYSFSAQEFVPFIAASGGVALDFPLANTNLFINPSVGIKWIAVNKLSLSFAAGVMTMIGPGDALRDSFISLKLGLELKGK